MKRALLLALFLAGVIAALSLRTHHAGGAQPEPSEALPQVSIRPSSVESSKPAIESANAVSTTARESLSTKTDASASQSEPDAKAPVCIRVLYAGSDRPIRAANVIVGPSLTEARTDERGVAEFRVPAGSRLDNVRVEAGDDGDPFVRYERSLERIVLPGNNEILVRVDRGIDMHGIVRDAAIDRPIAGAQVHYLGLCSRSKVTTREDGSFELLGMLGGPWNRPGELEVQHPRYLAETRALERADVAPDAQPFVVTMRRGVLISGRIVDSEHVPVPHASVSLILGRIADSESAPVPRGPVGPIRKGELPTTSDEHGRFEFGGLSPSERATLVVPMQPLPEGAILAGRRELGALQADMLDIELVVPAAVVLEVYAERPDGRAMATYQFEVHGFEEFFEGEDTPELRYFRTGIISRGSDAQIEVIATIALDEEPNTFRFGKAAVHPEPGAAPRFAIHVPVIEKGQFEIPPLPVGVAEVRVDTEYHFMGALDVQLLEAATGIPIARGHSLEVTVKGEITRAEAGPDGWLRLRGAPGAYVIQVQLGIGPRVSLPVTVPASGYAKTEWRLRSVP